MPEGQEPLRLWLLLSKYPSGALSCRLDSSSSAARKAEDALARQTGEFRFNHFAHHIQANIFFLSAKLPPGSFTLIFARRVQLLPIRLTSAFVNAAVLALPPRSPVRTLSIFSVSSMALRKRAARSGNLQ